MESEEQMCPACGTPMMEGDHSECELEKEESVENSEE